MKRKTERIKKILTINLKESMQPNFEQGKNKTEKTY